MSQSKSFSVTGILMFLLIAGLTDAKAQRIELSPFIGYETGSTVYTSLGYLYIGGGMDYGASLDFSLGRNRYAEISYSHMMTTLNVDDGSNERYLFDLGVNYYSIGILQETKPLSKISPYGLLTLGWVNFNPQTDDYSGENKMHVSLAGGVKIKATERIGLRLQARLLMPIFYAGANFNASTGGTSMNVSATSVAFQGDFTGALVFVIR
jgi:hypothetical protein